MTQFISPGRFGSVKVRSILPSVEELKNPDPVKYIVAVSEIDPNSKKVSKL
jgi:hypothetical protein